MFNPIRNVERFPGPGGPEASIDRGLGRSIPGTDPMRRRPHNYPKGRMRVAIGIPKLKLQEGGEVPEDPADLREPDDQLSPHDAQLKQIVVEAMAALRGQHPDPEKAIQRFIDTFGEDDYEELRQMVLGGQDQSGEPDSDEGMAGPGDQDGDEGYQVGGLLNGPGTGQSDEIHATTPSGRKVLLSDGEYVVDAPTVAALGDGSTNAGARRLDKLRQAVRQQAYGHGDQAKAMKKGGRAILEALNS